jgi:hypothetical protein
VRLGIQTIEYLHHEPEDAFATLYDLTGDPVFQRAFEDIHAVPHPLIHQGLPQ